MGLVGRFHPILVHFPIGLVLAGAAAELVAIRTRRGPWRAIAVSNLRAGAVMAAVTAIAGWALASASFIEPGRVLDWHEWIGTAAAVSAVVAALLSSLHHDGTHRDHAYQATLFASAVLVALAGHLGGTLVWGAAFTH